MYEVILNILDQKGPATIPLICQEVNQHPIFMQERDKPVQPSAVKSVISRKSDLFTVNDDIVYLLPEKELIGLTACVGGFGGHWFKVEVDFMQKNFTFFEWNLDPLNRLGYELVEAGNIDDFKQEIYRLKIWDWNVNYQQDGIILDGTSWSILLETRAKIYKSEGLQEFPKNWSKFCRAVSILAGKKFA